MTTQDVKGEDYLVQYEPETATVTFKGELALGGPKEYAPINDLLSQAVESGKDTVTLDLRELAFLNSSGISTLSKFVLGMRKKKNIQLVILGSEDMPWQGKSLKNLQKFLPSLKLEIQ